MKPRSTSNPAPRLRMALVATSLRLGGAEKQFVYMAQALSTTGIDVQFFYVGAGGHYEPVMRGIGLPFHQIYSPGSPLVRLARVIKALRKLRPHIVLVSQFSDLTYGGIAGRLCHALVLGAVRSDGFYELDTHGRCSRWMLRLCHGVIANSHRAKENLALLRVNSPPIEVLSNVIDLDDFDARAKLPVTAPFGPKRIVAAAVGRLHPSKRFDRFLHALEIARRSDPSIAGLIVGSDHGAKADLEQQANALGLRPEHLIISGESHQIPSLLTQAQMLVLCSECEGFPNVILEAMAARLPVVTTPIGDAGLVVQEGKTGCVVPAENPKGIAECILRLAQSPELRRQFGEAGRQRVEREYRCELLPSRLLSLCHQFAIQERNLPLRRQILQHQPKDRPVECLVAVPHGPE